MKATMAWRCRACDDLVKDYLCVPCLSKTITGTTPIINKIRKLEKLIIDEKVTLVDDDGKPLEKVDYPGDYDSKDCGN
ncbi:hypothetical protein Tco_1532078 [Tanacetum coccineum]